MSAAKTQIQLTVDLLRSTTDDRFVKAIKSLEQRGESDEVQQIRSQVRDRLKEMRPPRRLNLTRIFCEPFEEMLRNSVVGQSSWVPRSAILPCWRVVEGYVDAKLLIQIRHEIETLTDVSQEQLCTLGEPLWEAAGKALAKVAAAAREGDKAALELFDN